MEDRLILDDQGLWGLVNATPGGRGPSKAERVDSMLRRIYAATDGVNARCNVELVVRIHDPQVDATSRKGVGG